MRFVPKKVPLNWYRYDVRFSVELLFEYIQGVEQEITKSIDNFRKHIEIRIEDASSLEEARVKRVFRTLDDETWHLETVFEDYFPNIQRRSALITLYSFLEHELNQLCNLFVEVEGFRIGLDDINSRGGGIHKASLFLEKVVGLAMDRSRFPWDEIKNIQSLRNRIVHEDGTLRTKNDPLRAYVKSSPVLSGETEITILNGYLDHVLNTFDLQFQELEKLIEARAKQKH